MLNQAQAKLGGDGENDVLCAWRIKAIEDIAYSLWKVKHGFEKFGEENLYFKNATTSEMLKKLTGFRVK